MLISVLLWVYSQSYFHSYILFLFLLYPYFSHWHTHILFLVNPQCLHVTQKLTEAGSIFGDICHQQCMTVEKSVKIYSALYWMVPIDLHLPDTVTDRANQPIMALETDRHSFIGEMGWDEFDWLTDCHWTTRALQNHLLTAGEQYYIGVRVCIVCSCTWVCMHGCVCESKWSALHRLPIAPWVWWQVKNQAVRLAQPTSSKTGRIK